MRRLLLIGMIVGLLASLAACSGSETDADPTPTAAPTTTIAPTTTAAPTPPTAVPVASTTEVIPFHAIPDDSVGVTGTADCRFSETGVDPKGGPGLLVVCELDMSDPRVSGTETDDRQREYETGEVAVVWVVEEAVIVNDEGSWRGFMQAADDSTPCGEAHFIGEDAYEGLEFHYYFCHAGDLAEIRGWISSSE